MIADRIDEAIRKLDAYQWEGAADINPAPVLRVASDTIRTLLSRIEELESAAALAGNLAIEQAARAVDGMEKRGETPEIAAAYGCAAALIRSLSKPIDRNALIERGARAAAEYLVSPTMIECPGCSGKGHHHGFGEDGRDPDWCLTCGGSQYVEDPHGVARAVLSAWIGEETK